MAPTISQFLLDFTKNWNYHEVTPSLLLHYLDANLIFLRSNLVPDNFKRVLSVIWSTSAASLSSIIHEAIGKLFNTSITKAKAETAFSKGTQQHCRWHHESCK